MSLKNLHDSSHEGIVLRISRNHAQSAKLQLNRTPLREDCSTCGPSIIHFCSRSQIHLCKRHSGFRSKCWCQSVCNLSGLLFENLLPSQIESTHKSSQHPNRTLKHGNTTWFVKMEIFANPIETILVLVLESHDPCRVNAVNDGHSHATAYPVREGPRQRFQIIMTPGARFVALPCVLEGIADGCPALVHLGRQRIRLLC
mmetsp:Transcript_2149/g.7837  ORF Transcript_2149/g.7837 Transcript_2149/m.7837 type:complete len:200 (+) Transcript_2149:2782-3381(+)